MFLANHNAAFGFGRLLAFVATAFAPMRLSASMPPRRAENTAERSAGKRATGGTERRFRRLAALLLASGLFATLAAPGQAQMPDPILTLSSPQDGRAVNEGETISLILNLDAPIPSDADGIVQIQVGEHPLNTHLRDYNSNPDMSGVTSLTIPIHTMNDMVAEADSRITVTASREDFSPYQLPMLGETGASVVVDIYDDDQAEITATVSGEVNEFGMVPGMDPADPPDDVVFTFTLQRAGRGEMVLLEYETVNGSATAGMDYVAQAGTLTFAAAATNATSTTSIRIEVMDDEVPERERENFRLRLRPIGATAPEFAEAIIISDEVAATPSARLNENAASRVAAAVTGRVSRVIHDRVGAVLDPGGDLIGEGALPFLDGFLDDLLITSGGLNPSNYRDKLSLGVEDVRFTTALAPGVAALDDWGSWFGMPWFRVGSMTAWGQGYHQGIGLEQGEGDDTLDLDGGVTGLLLGMDAHTETLVLGLALSRAEAELDYEFSENNQRGASEGTHNTELDGIYPYVGGRPLPGVRVWGGLGLNQGELEITDGFTDVTTAYDVRMHSLSLGANGSLRSRLHGDEQGATRLEVIGDLNYARFTGRPQDRTVADDFGATSTTARAGLEYGYDRLLPSGHGISAGAQAGMRHDAGHGLEGTGLEVGGEVVWFIPDSGLRVDANAHALLLHSKELAEWGIAGALRWYALADPSRGGLGLVFEPQWGHAAVGKEGLWERGFGEAEPHEAGLDAGATAGYALEMKYGIALARDGEMVTLFLRDRRHGARAAATGHTGLGADYRFGGDLSAGYEAVIGGGHTDAQADHRGYIRYQRRF